MNFKYVFFVIKKEISSGTVTMATYNSVRNSLFLIECSDIHLTLYNYYRYFFINLLRDDNRSIQMREYVLGTSPSDFGNKIVFLNNTIKAQLKIHMPCELLRIILKFSDGYVESDLFRKKHYNDAINKLMSS